MKIDRVVIALDNNQNYADFWDITSYVWKEKFKIKPTLIFNGTKEEFARLNLNTENCEYIILNKILEVSESKPDWSVTWSLFWGASQFKDDTCMLSGIDQIPISNLFFETIKKYSSDKFIVGFADAYSEYDINTLGYFNIATNVMYPSSHLVGYGNNFKEIFEIDDDWEKEIIKVHSSKDRYHLKNKFYPNKLWGLDECYASEKISLYTNINKIVYMDFFWDKFEKRRLHVPSPNVNINMDLVKKGYYSEFTSKNISIMKPLVEQIVSNIKEY